VKHRWAPIGGSLLVGVSLGFPLFLYMREIALESPQVPEGAAD
jgi:Terpene cyclase DEP1